MFDLIERTAKAAVGVAADTVELALGGSGPSREDVATLVEAGMTAAAIASALGTTEEIVQALIAGSES